MKKKIIYCPLCLKRGKKKILGQVSDDTIGTLYLWCKIDRKEIEIEVANHEQSGKKDDFFKSG